jgi:hypothetical protein
MSAVSADCCDSSPTPATAYSTSRASKYEGSSDTVLIKLLLLLYITSSYMGDTSPEDIAYR